MAVSRIAPLLFIGIMVIGCSFVSGEITMRSLSMEDDHGDVKGTIHEYVDASGPDSADILSFSVRNESGTVNASLIIKGEVSGSVAYEIFIGQAYFSYYNGFFNGVSNTAIEDLEYPMPYVYAVHTNEINVGFPASYIPDAREGDLLSFATYGGRVTDVCPDAGSNVTYDLTYEFEHMFFDGEEDLIEHVEREEISADRPYLDILGLDAVDDGERVTFTLVLAARPSVKKEVEYKIYSNQVQVRISQGVVRIEYADSGSEVVENMVVSGNAVIVKADRFPSLPLTRDRMHALAREALEDGVSAYVDEIGPKWDISVWNVDYSRLRSQLVIRPAEDMLLMVHLECHAGLRYLFLEAFGDADGYAEAMQDPEQVLDALVVPVVTLDGIELEPELVLLEETLFSPVGDIITLTWTYTIPHEELSGGSHTVGYHMRDLPYMMNYYDPGDLEIMVEGGWEISRVDRTSEGYAAEQKDRTSLRTDARVPDLEFTIREARKGGEGTCFGIAGAIGAFAAIAVILRSRL